MSTFLDQFYETPVDTNSLYLQKMLSNYSSFKSVKKLTEEAVMDFKGIHSSEKEHYLYESKDERFIFTIGSLGIGEDYATIEFLEKTSNRLRQNGKLPYKIIYTENDKNEFIIDTHWPSGKEILKNYTVLKYNRTDRVILKKTTYYDPSKLATDEAAEIVISLSSVTKTWLNKHRNKHSQNLPAEIIFTKNLTHVLRERWYQRNKLHRANLPAETIYDIKNRVKKEAFYYNDQKHNLEEAAEWYYNYTENNIVKIWYQNDELITTSKVKI